MAYIVKQKVHGKDYYYLRKSVREGTKVISKNLGYLGKDKKQAEIKAKEIIKQMKNEIPKQNEKVASSRKLIKQNISVEELANFCKRKGFVYQSGEIYGGLAGFWDFGPLGVELKNNLKQSWWDFHVKQREDIVGIDGSIITHPQVWKASGHVDSFSDVFVLCKKCKKPNKIDKNELGKVKCPCGGEYDESTAKDFKLMFETNVGTTGTAYLRPETAQLIFSNFKSVYENSRMKLPFGIAQIGKAFRNEIAPRDFLFRCREFEQMEIEYFIKKDQKCVYKIPNVEILVYSSEDQEKNKEAVKMKIKLALEKGIIKKDWHAYWLANEFLWFKQLGANPNNFRIRQHEKDELAHYSSDCWDLEFKFPFGWKELQGIADRSDYDLSQHEKFSKKDLKVFDEETKEKFLPFVICEPSLGVERAFLVFLFDAFYKDSEKENFVLSLDSLLAPIKVAIFPIVKRKDLEKIARNIFDNLKQKWNVVYDQSGSIGRRYARNDEIGTLFCITVDEESLKKQEVTIRNRDTSKQIKIKISELENVLEKLINKKIEFEKAGKVLN
ncbi:MAG: glycine--tRNA ligase [Nanoarchaeota archaeon]|nr:glycine--tRNA ligase [Nanoarchaeota archaeon]MBU4308345.1 glycine--tRNA ligase [Nanoarchaeota archaeon]